jgi:hypothetical protein
LNICKILNKLYTLLLLKPSILCQMVSSHFIFLEAFYFLLKEKKLRALNGGLIDLIMEPAPIRRFKLFVRFLFFDMSTQKGGGVSN